MTERNNCERVVLVEDKTLMRKVDFNLWNVAADWICVSDRQNARAAHREGERMCCRASSAMSTRRAHAVLDADHLPRGAPRDDVCPTKSVQTTSRRVSIILRAGRAGGLPRTPRVLWWDRVVHWRVMVFFTYCIRICTVFFACPLQHSSGHTLW